MKLQGVFHQQLIQILVDSGDTDNFIDVTLTTKLDIHPNNPRQMDAIVANIEKLCSGASCK